MKKYSFVIPSYNCKSMLRNTLEALNCQTGFGYDDYEVVVVDDGSDDGTWEHIRYVNKNYMLKYIYLEREPCSCRARARNFGWKSAEGEIIIFIDADIIVKPTYLSELERFYKYEKNLMVMGLRLMLPRGVIIDFDDLYQIYGFDRKKLTLLDKTYFIYDLLSYNISRIRSPGILFATNNGAVPRQSLEAIDGFDENYIGYGYEDQDLACRLLKTDSIKFALNNKLEVLHQYHPHYDYVDSELKNNGKLFLSKFPYAEGNIPMSQEVDIWGVLGVPDDKFLSLYDWKHHKEDKNVIIDYSNIKDIEEIKERIFKLSTQKGLDIVVNDYIEQGDLDIWIQLLGERESTPKYFPVSKKIGWLSVAERQWLMSPERQPW